MSDHRPISLLLLILLLLSACTTWYKPGADVEELSAIQQRCRDESGAANGPTFLECMQAAGWRHTHIAAPLSESEPATVQAVGAVTPNAQVNPDKASNTGTATTRDNPVATAPSTGSASGMQDGQQRGQTIHGWVQVGDAPRPLDEARKACAAIGGDSQKFRQCMQSKGWRRLGIRITVEEPGDLD